MDYGLFQIHNLTSAEIVMVQKWATTLRTISAETLLRAIQGWVDAHPE